MKIVSIEAMRLLDDRTIKEKGIPGKELMDRAGLCVANEVEAYLERNQLEGAIIRLIAGRGNNGGDAFAAAYHLFQRDLLPLVLLAGTVDQVKGDAAEHLERMQEEEIALLEVATPEEWDELRNELRSGTVIVDGLLGTGTKGPVRGPTAAAIDFIRACSRRSYVVAIDVPSGLDPDTGTVQGPAVQADLTVSIGLPKRGLLADTALPYVGKLEVVDIGFPREYVEELPGEEGGEALHRSDVLPWFSRRDRGAHKGNYGHVVLIGGARGYAGAMSMATAAAARCGAGLVSALVPESIAPIVAAYCPEVMVHAAPETDTGSLAARGWAQWAKRLGDFDAIGLGPGMTRHADTREWVQQVLQKVSCPVVLDADALSVLADEPSLLSAASCPVVCTPHPGEFATLFGLSVEEVQADRVRHARDQAKQAGITLVLKGARTVIAQPDGLAYINMTGNPGMATGGTGDVLTGMITSLLGQGHAPFQAAGAGVWIHGEAGDRVAANRSETTLLASDLLDAFPAIFRDLCIR